MLKMEDKIETLIRSRYPILLIKTWEEQRAYKMLRAIAKEMKKRVFLWSITDGLRDIAIEKDKDHIASKTKDPMSALQQVMDGEEGLYIFKDFGGRFWDDPRVNRKTRDLYYYIKQEKKTLIVISPSGQVHDFLEKEITLLELPFPTLTELTEILTGLLRSAGCNLPEEQEIEALAGAAKGLTWIEAENSFAKAIVETNTEVASNVDRVIKMIINDKVATVRKTELLEFYPDPESIESIGGLDLLKEFLRKRGRAFSKEAEAYGLPTPRGVLLIGVQGCGKSICAKGVASLWRLPLLRQDMGKLFGSLVGESEDKTRRALSLAEALAPCVLWFDEIEKGLSGMSGSGRMDSGVTARVIGTILTWLQEKKAPVFVVATANNIDSIPPELMRKGRLDEVFFVDLPSKAEREEIFKIHIEKKGRIPKNFLTDILADDSQGFSGAEIEESINSALYDAFDQGTEINTGHIRSAIRNIVPLSTMRSEEIEAMRKWATERARPAQSKEDKKSGERKLEIRGQN